MRLERKRRLYVHELVQDFTRRLGTFIKKILIECRKQSIIALIFLFFALWLAQKTCTTTSTNQLQIHTSNDLVERVFPPFGLYVIFTCFWLVIEITLALVLPPYLCSGALDPGSPRLQRNVVSAARPHGNIFHMPKDPDGKKKFTIKAKIHIREIQVFLQ